MPEDDEEEEEPPSEKVRPDDQKPAAEQKATGPADTKWEPRAARKAKQLADAGAGKYAIGAADRKLAFPTGVAAPVSAGLGAISGIPDVARLPAPAGRVPIPYPHTGRMHPEAGAGKKVTPGSKDPGVIRKGKASLKESRGDEPGTLKGMIAGKMGSKLKSGVWSMDVKLGKSERQAKQTGLEPTQVVRLGPKEEVKDQAKASVAEYLKYPKGEEARTKAKERGEETTRGTTKSTQKKEGKTVIVANPKKRLTVPLDTETLAALSDKIAGRLESQAQQERDVTGAD